MSSTLSNVLLRPPYDSYQFFFVKQQSLKCRLNLTTDLRTLVWWRHKREFQLNDRLMLFGEDEINACFRYQTQRNSLSLSLSLCERERERECVCVRERKNQNCPGSCRAIKESVTTVHYPHLHPDPVLRIHSHIVVPQLENKHTKTTSLLLFSIHTHTISLSLLHFCIPFTHTFSLSFSLSLSLSLYLYLALTLLNHIRTLTSSLSIVSLFPDTNKSGVNPINEI